MKDTFQAKDIQNIIGIPKYRYEYLATKIGIKPDIAEVDGQGRTHLYSFRNLMQFAFVHHASGIGLSPKAARQMLFHIEEFDSERFFEKKITNLLFSFIKHPDCIYIKVGEQILQETSESISPDDKNKIGGPRFKAGKTKMVNYDKEKERIFDDANSYVTINFGTIKRRILESLAG